MRILIHSLVLLAVVASIAPGIARSGSDKKPDRKIDINQASLEELKSLHLVGQKRAKAIIEERDKNGPFASLRDLASRVKGIGPEMIKKWEPNVTLPMGEEEDDAKRLPYPIDVNSATEEDLVRLYRVGPIIAKRIVQERAKNGPYSSLEELSKRVKGVGPALIGQWKQDVTNRLSDNPM